MFTVDSSVWEKIKSMKWSRNYKYNVSLKLLEITKDLFEPLLSHTNLHKNNNNIRSRLIYLYKITPSNRKINWSTEGAELTVSVAWRICRRRGWISPAGLSSDSDNPAESIISNCLRWYLAKATKTRLFRFSYNVYYLINSICSESNIQHFVWGWTNDGECSLLTSMQLHLYFIKITCSCVNFSLLYTSSEFRQFNVCSVFLLLNLVTWSCYRLSRFAFPLQKTSITFPLDIINWRKMWIIFQDSIRFS